MNRPGRPQSCVLLGHFWQIYPRLNHIFQRHIWLTRILSDTLPDRCGGRCWGEPPMLRKALAAAAFAAILLCVFDSAPADAQGYGRYRGGAGIGVYRGPRGGG